MTTKTTAIIHVSEYGTYHPSNDGVWTIQDTRGYTDIGPSCDKCGACECLPVNERNKTMTMTTDYEKQAQDFLNATNTVLTISEGDTKPARWDVYGYHYEVTLRRAIPIEKYQYGDNKINGQSYTFDFWDSYANMGTGKKPTAYDVLTCLDVYDGDMHDFEMEYGYDHDRCEHSYDLDTESFEDCEVLDVYKAVIEQTRELKRLFSEEELEALQEIN